MFQEMIKNFQMYTMLVNFYFKHVVVVKVWSFESVLAKHKPKFFSCTYIENAKSTFSFPFN